MVRNASLKDVLHITNRAQSIRVVLTWASDPGFIILDMRFARGMSKSKESTRQYRHEVLLVVDVGDIQVCIDVICERLVASSRHSVTYHLDWDTGKVERQEDSFQQSLSGTEGVSNDRYLIHATLIQSFLDSREDIASSFSMSIGKSVMDFDIGADTGEKGRIKVVEEEVCIRK